MKIRFKIVSTIVSMCLALAVMGFAVWAASTQSLLITNTVDFVSIHVLSTVTGSVTGAKIGTFEDYGPVITLAGDEEGKLGTWAIGSAMEFADETEPIVITLTIVNNSDERSLSFELGGQAYAGFNGTNLGDTNIDRTCIYSISNATPITNATYTSGAINVEPLKTATIVMTLDISDNGKSVTAFNNNFAVTLRNVETGANFSFDNVTKILTISEGITLTEENIPEMIVEGEPAFYGLFEDELYTQKIELPYSGATTLYAKFSENISTLTFTSILSDTQYSVKGNLSNLPIGSLEIPERYNWKPVTQISNNAFQECNLTSIIIPNYVTIIGNEAFMDCSNLVNVTIPNNLTSIGTSAFESSGLTSLILNDGLTSIGISSFHDCLNLATITIPDSVEIIGAVAFDGTSWLNNQPDGLVYAGKHVYKYKGVMPISTSISLLTDTKGIVDSAFLSCETLINITIPNGVTYIGNSAFFECTGLTNIILPNSVTSLATGVFRGCTGLTSITLPNNLTSLPGNAFYYCSSLTSITIPSSITSIGNSAFRYCSNLKTIIIDSSTIANGLIDVSVFGNLLDNLTTESELYILDSISSIGSYVTNTSNFNAPVVVDISGINYKKFIKI